jgi:regulator of replication initiation timing
MSTSGIHEECEVCGKPRWAHRKEKMCTEIAKTDAVKDLRSAVYCLNLEVDPSIAEDVRRKAEAVIVENSTLRAELERLRKQADPVLAEREPESNWYKLRESRQKALLWQKRAETAESALSQAQQALRRVKAELADSEQCPSETLAKIEAIVFRPEAALPSDTPGAQAQEKK